MGDLSRDFNRSEFACRCGCGEDAVSPRLVEALQAMRDRMARPMYINSGCRCRYWNAHEGGKPDSAHLCGPSPQPSPHGGEGEEGGEVCEAADLAAPDSATRYDLVAAALASGVRRIGIGTDFIHVDVDGAKVQEVLWLYS
jgi:hypothetical protein